ncbi:MAG TPA: sodium-transporting two-sector ATPase [Candidatus Saccharimonadales bacterium]|nr:sodium-transporting two-sector ATPase [Candidatus Saccharimonadales bacterium]
MFDNARFQHLVEADNLTGEVVASNSFIIEVRGLEGVRLGAQVLFEDGQRGIVREAYGDRVILFNVNTEKMAPGTLAVVENDVLSIPVGKGLVGRVVNPLGEPLDGKGPVHSTATSGIFNPAPGIMDRKVLDTQLSSGVAAVDSFFAVVLGQRIAILGDSKSGKSTFLSQLAAMQHGNGRIVVYVLVGKRKVDIEFLLTELEKSGAMKHTIVVMADIFDSLTQSYLAPYAGCAMAEYLWHNGEDVIVIYDDLSGHAEAYRQLSLLQEVDPGRDSYPGDMFYAHSSLLERAGKLKSNGKTLTALPVVLTPNNDITAYLPTNIMSITDGQIVLDLNLFREGIRPAVNAGLSVSRVGGQAQTHRQKTLGSTLFQKLAKYRQAEEFSHFGSSLSKEATVDLALGKQIYAALQQSPTELHNPVEQQLILETVLLGNGAVEMDIAGLKESAKTMAPKVKDDKDFDKFEAELLKKHGKRLDGAAESKPEENKPEGTAEPPATPDSNDDKAKDGKPEKDDKKQDEPETKPVEAAAEAPKAEEPASDKEPPKGKAEDKPAKPKAKEKVDAKS